MRIRYSLSLLLALVVVVCLGVLPAGAQQIITVQDDAVVLDADLRARVIGTLADLLETNYVDPDLANEMADYVRTKLADGGYDDITEMADFARSLGRELRAISHDMHLGFAVLPPGIVIASEPNADDLRADLRSNNYGFLTVRRLIGNVGYLDMRSFSPPMLEDEPIARDAAAAAMNSLAGADAIIIDLRANGGGDPAMVQFISSFLFGTEPVHLNSLYYRNEDRTEEFWTLEDVPGTRMPDVPVYILTSGSTFSAAEEFAYDLQALGRATIVGETTGGGANPVNGFPVEGVLAAFIPTGKAINAITGTNWEGVGVMPDVETPQSQALEQAQLLALAQLADDNEELRTAYERAQANVRATYHPAEVAPEVMARYAGLYERLHITYQDGKLYEGSALTPVSETRFAAVDSLLQFEFDVQADGTVSGAWMIFADDNRVYLQRVEAAES